MFGFNFVFSYLLSFMFLNIVSWNARGLLNKEKFEKMEVLCKEADVIVLQETNWRNERVKWFQAKWDGNMHFNNEKDNVGGGVAILIRRRVCGKEQMIFEDGVGKSMAVKIEIEEENLIIYNIHAPNEEREKMGFFLKKIADNVKKLERVILLGDLNTVFSELDMASNMVLEIDRAEIDRAIPQLKPGESPGVDGLINEFYKEFRVILVSILKEVYDEIFKKEVLGEKMKIGMIKMVYKKRGNSKDLNFRPITMLNWILKFWLRF